MEHTYIITVRFKDNKQIEIKSVAKDDPREIFQDEWKNYKKEGAIAIGDYIFDIDEILYIKVEGGDSEKRSRGKVSGFRKKVK